MIFRLSILWTFIVCTQLSSQPLDFTIKWGEEFSAPRHSSLNDIVGHDAAGIYTVKVRNEVFALTSYTLERYDNNFRPVRSHELEITEYGERARIQYILQLKRNLYIFYVVRNRSTNKSELYVRQINKNTLEPETTKVKLAEIDEGRYDRGIPFKFRTSRDSSMVAVSYEFHSVEQKELKSFGFLVLDEDLQPIWKKQVTLSHQEDLFSIESFKVDNSGNVYLLGVSYQDKRKSKRKGKPNYNYEVIAWSNAGEVATSYPVVLQDRFLTDMQIEVVDKKLVCAGFYSAAGTFSIKGTYFLTVDLESKEIKTTSFKDFGLDFIIENMSEREANRAAKKTERGDEVEMYEYDLDKLLVGKDGSAILIGEQYFVEQTQSSMYINGRVSYTTTYHYYYNDIIAVKVNPQGQIEWTQKVSKSQHTIDDGGFFSSYTLAIVHGKVCFFFNDHPENVNYKGVGRPLPYRAKESVVILASLNQKGEQTRQPVFALRDVEVITRPKVCEQISNREVILFGQRKKTQQFARVEFD